MTTTTEGSGSPSSPSFSSPSCAHEADVEAFIDSVKRINHFPTNLSDLFQLDGENDTPNLDEINKYEEIERLIKARDSHLILTFTLLNDLKAFADPMSKSYKRLFNTKGDEYLTIHGVRFLLPKCSPFEAVGIHELLVELYGKLETIPLPELKTTYQRTMSDIKRTSREQSKLSNLIRKDKTLYTLLGGYYRAVVAVFDTSRGMAESYSYEIRNKLDDRFYGWCKAAINKIIKSKSKK